MTLDGCTHRSGRDGGGGQREVVHLPSAQELGAEDLTDEGARVVQLAELNVPLGQQLETGTGRGRGGDGAGGVHLERKKVAN